MTGKERIRCSKLYEDYKLAYIALILVYPFGLEDLDGEVWKKIGFGGVTTSLAITDELKVFIKEK